MEWLTLELLVSSVAYLLTVMLTTMLSGILCKMGYRYGKVLGSEEFQSKATLYWAFLIEAVILSLAFAYFESALIAMLLMGLRWLPSIVVEAFVIYYIWFCLTFGYKIHWQPLVLPQFIPILNYIVGFAFG